MIRKVCLALAASTALIAGTAHASSDYFLKIDGITGGSSTEVGFRFYSDIYSFSLGFSRGICSDLSVAKEMDAASPDMTSAALLGTFFPRAVLVGRTLSGSDPFIYMKLTLNNVIISSISQSAASGGGDLPSESVSIQPTSVRIESFKQDEFGHSVPVADVTVTCQKVK